MKLDRDPLDVDYPRAVLVVLLLATVLGLAAAAGTSGTAFGAYNPSWDGATELRTVADETGTDHQVVLETAAYERTSAAGTVAVVLSPDEPYTTVERARIRAFVRRGGTLVVAEDYGPHGNPLLAGVGASARVDGRPLRDPQSNYRTPAFPVATNVSDHPFTAGVGELALNHGTAVRANGSTPLVTATRFSYLDGNRNGTLDADESLRPRPVATVEEVGAGRVVAVSDPSLFINAMLDHDGNRAFARALLGPHERVLLDYSHAERPPPLAAAVLVLRGTLWLQTLLALGTLGLVVAWGRGGIGRLVDRLTGDDPDRRPGLDEAELRAYVEREHPDWEAARVERVTKGIIRRRDQSRDDD